MRKSKAFYMALLLAFAVLLPQSLASEEYYSISDTELTFLQATLDKQSAMLREWSEKSQNLEKEVTRLSETVKKQDSLLKEYAKKYMKERDSRDFWLTCTMASVLINIGLGIALYSNVY